MSNDLPALTNTHVKSTLYGDGKIILPFATFILLELKEECQRYLSLPLSVSFPLSLSRCGLLQCRKRWVL